MKQHIEEQAVNIADYIIEQNVTVRHTAKALFSFQKAWEAV